MTSGPLGWVPPAEALAALRHRAVNYTTTEVKRPDWHFDAHRCTIGWEEPGPATADGPWAMARAVLRDYEFTPPRLVRAVYDPRTPLLGRELLLEGRFSALRFQMGVRITSLILSGDQDHDVYGWSYRTLDGHLERGEVVYQVVKRRATGKVEFTATSHSQVDPQLGPILRLGWRLFGRRTQLRFYREIQRRMRVLAQEPKPRPRRDTLMAVPSGAPRHPLDRFALYRYDPARSRLHAS